MLSKSEKLVSMANQIARNTAIQGEERAVAATQRHFKLFWEPRMRHDLGLHLKAGGHKDLHPIALKAFENLTPVANVETSDVKATETTPVAKEASSKPAAKKKGPAKA